MNNDIPVYMAADVNVLRCIPPAVRSLCENTTEGISLTLLLDEAAYVYRDELATALKRFKNLQMRFIRLDRATLPKMNQGERRYLSPMAYARLQIPDFAEHNRVLYLDVDLVVRGDISELYRFDLKDNCIAAARDCSVPDYFNSGVLLIDCHRWHANRVTETANERIRSGDRIPDADQELLNDLLRGAWAELPAEWNFMMDAVWGEYDVDTYERAKIVHFITGFKPWTPIGRLVHYEEAIKLWDRYDDRRGSFPRRHLALSCLLLPTLIRDRRGRQILQNRLLGRGRKSLHPNVPTTVANL